MFSHLSFDLRLKNLPNFFLASFTLYLFLSQYLFVQSMNNMTEGGYGSGGPVRRTRNKYTSATPSRESTLFSTAQRSPLARESFVDLTPKKFFEPGSSSTAVFNSLNSKEKSPEAGVQSVHPHSSRVARHILEQLDRPVTVKQKSNEMKLATSWKDSAVAALATPVQNISSSSTPEASASINKNANGVSFFAQINGKNYDLPQEGTHTITGAGKDIFGSTTSLDKKSSTFDASSGLSHSRENFNPQRSPEQVCSILQKNVFEFFLCLLFLIFDTTKMIFFFSVPTPYLALVLSSV